MSAYHDDLESEENAPVQWVTKEGVRLDVWTMENRHLLYSLRFLDRRRDTMRHDPVLYAVLRYEVARRGLTPLRVTPSEREAYVSAEAIDASMWDDALMWGSDD